MSNLYIYEQGSNVSYRENRLIVTGNKDKSGAKEVISCVPIENIDNIVMFGGVQVSTACIQQLLSKGIPLTWLSKTGSYFGRLESTSHINIERQRMQFRKGDDENFRLEISKRFIRGKACNQRTILLRGRRYLKDDKFQDIIQEMSGNISKIEYAPSIEILMGIEGNLARLYFKALNQILKDDFKFEKRSKRPPKDPFNSMISFGYTLLHYEIFTALVSKGLNPYAAFLHSDKHNHPALCSDLMEEWRAILVETLSLSLINSEKIARSDFDYDHNTGAVYMSKEACRKYVGEFEKRLRQEVGYIKEVPYKMSFRRMIEYQIMQLIKAIESGNADLYQPVLIR